MKNKRMVALAAGLALALSACAGGGGGTETSAAAGDPNRIITAYNEEPQNPLMPADTGEVSGGRVVELLFAGLVSYDASGKAVNELAESIETEDAQNYTIKLKGDSKFTNGEAVTAKSFVDTWNFAANVTNAQQSSTFYRSIEGYSDVSNTKVTGKDAEGKDIIEPDPLADTMTGLAVVDDTTFTVQLSQPESDFPLRLGYSAFMPLPSAAIADKATYGENPIGNGPYMMAAQGAWKHDVEIALVKNPDYKGPREAKNGGVTFKVYTDPGAAYTDVQGNNLDVLDIIPPNALKTYESDLPGQTLNKSVAANGTLNIPVYLPEWSGEAGKLRRQAVSYAINRDEITKVVFNGARIPAKEFGAASIDGYKEDIPGSEVLNFDADKAKQLWADADKIQPWDPNKIFTIAYNTGGGNKEWVDAVANNLKNNLGIKAEGQPFATFAEMLDLREAKTLTGAVRAGWQFDYPSLYNGLGDVYGTGAGSNYEGYSNPEFDALLKEGLGEADPQEGIKKFQEAEAILFEDLPNLPLWYTSRQAAWSETVSNVDAGWSGVILYYNITAQ